MSNDINALLISVKCRANSAKHFGADSLYIAVEQVQALIKALEAKQPHHNGMMQLSNELVMAKQRIAELENYAEAEAVGSDKAAEDSVYWMNRYKELESRTVTVKLPDKIEPDEVPDILDPTANPDEYACCVGADMWNKALAACRQTLNTAGIQVIEGDA